MARVICKMLRALCLTALVFVLTGCGNGSKQDIISRTKNVKTGAELKSKLGKPDSFEAGTFLGNTGEKWVYKGSDGNVVFIVVNDNVTTSFTE